MTTDEDFYVNRLDIYGIKPTAIRLLIIRQMFRGNEMVSLPDLERCLPTVDKSTISRTLSLFLARKLVHSVDDGSGAMKYALSDGEEKPVMQDRHIHFCCTLCRRTFCLKQIHTPSVTLPAGFDIHNINSVRKGLCPEGNRNKTKRS